MQWTVAVLLAAAAVVPAQGAVVVEVYDDPAAFAARLGGAVRTVTFDDVDTSAVDPAPFAADRYAASAGIVITGDSGQYASRDFGFPGDYPVSSAPNAYAPGPVDDTAGGGRFTEVTFRAGADAGLVAGFGAAFVDPDLPLESRLIAFDRDGAALGEADVPAADGDVVFRGLVAADDATGAPVPAIARVAVFNGTGWPGGTLNDGVPLDDFTFGVPVTTGATTTSTTTTIVAPGAPTSTTLAPSGPCPSAPSTDCRRPVASGRSTLVVRARANGATLRWIWGAGGATSKDDFGDPASQTGFAFCLYDAGGLRATAQVPPAATCGRRLCWSSTPSGWVYRDPARTSDGVGTLRLRSGADGAAQVTLRASGAPGPALPLAPPVTGRLVRTDATTCWDARFSLPKKSTSRAFVAQSD